MKVRMGSVVAHNRTMKGWKTRRSRRGVPSHWERPSGQKVALKGLSATEYHQIKPALDKSDHLLKVNPSVKEIRMEKFRGKKSRRSGEFQTGYFEKPGTIYLNRKAFSVDSNYKISNPAGTLAHEIGHSISPGAKPGYSYNQYKDFRKSFDYRKPRGVKDAEVWNYKRARKNPLPKRKSLQGMNAMEDFAETYRGYTGLSTDKYGKSKDVYLNKKRDEHFKRYYLK